MVDYRHPHRSDSPAARVSYEHPRRVPAAGVSSDGPPDPTSYDHPRRRPRLVGVGYRLRELPDGTPQRFDPERTIGVTANVDQAGRWAVQDLEQAFWYLKEATGLTFRFDGLTALIPQQRLNEHVDPAQPSMHVCWAKPGPVAGGSDLLPPEEPVQDGNLRLAVGVACSRVGEVPTAGGRALAIVRSTIVIDSSVRELYSPGFSTGGSRGSTLLHELAHAVGLDHVDDPTQLMHPVETGQPAAYGAGDLAGLGRVGSAAGPLPLL